MPPTRSTDNHYVVLGIPSTATQEEIRASYRKLAIVLHPDKNPDNPDATASFQRLATAYEVLGDPASRKVYDTARKQSNISQWVQQATAKRRAEAAESHRRKTPAESATDKKKYYEQLQRLDQYRIFYENGISEARKKLEDRKVDLQRFQDQEAAALKQESQTDGLWPFVFPRPHKMSKEEVEEQRKLSKERKNQQRAARRQFIEGGIEQEEARIKSLTASWQGVVDQMSTVRKQWEAEVQESTKEEERLKKEEEAQRQTANERARQEWDELAEQHKAAEASSQRANARAREVREWFERAAREGVQPISANFNSGSTSSAPRNGCRHEKFWLRVGGLQICQNCEEMQWHFLFQCPGCQMVACQNCRESLREEAWGMR